MKKVLVTGGSGFIGSNLAEELIRQGLEVRILDNLSTGSRKNLKNIESKAEFIKGDIRDMDIVKRCVDGVHCVFHQAAIPSVPRSISEPIKTNEVNVNGTLNMLLASKEAGVKKFVFAGSSSVYGESKTLPKIETMKPDPLSPYASSKIAGECYCQAFYRSYGLETVVLRYFNVYGPRQDPNSEYAAVIPKFITMLMKGKSPTIYGDGNQTRDFTFVDDVVSANILAMKSGSNTSGKAYNISCGKQITINELFNIIRELTGKHIEPVYTEERQGDIRDSVASIESAKKDLSFEPKNDLRAGLKKTIRFYENNGA